MFSICCGVIVVNVKRSWLHFIQILSNSFYLLFVIHQLQVWCVLQFSRGVILSKVRFKINTLTPMDIDTSENILQ